MSRLIPYRLNEVPVQQFYGGQSSDEAIGTAASFSYSRALEHRRNPSQLTVLPGPRKISGSVVTDLILNVIQTKSGDRYAFGDTGKVYKISTANVVTLVTTLTSGTDGAVYRSDSDACYFATQTDLRRYYPMSGTPTFDVTYGASRSTDAACYRTGGAATYTVPTAISEAATDYCAFTPDIEPFYSIKVKVVSKGTGNLTLTLHDGLNNSLASVTIPNASLPATAGLVEFVFPSQIRALVKPNARTYHFHLTTSTGTTTVQTTTASNFSTADYELWAYRFVQTNNGFHPMAQFQQFTLIGNGRYLAVWEPLTDSNPPNNEFQRHRITLPDGYEVCGIAVTDEFAVIAAEKYSTDGTKDFQDGKLFLWDGVATTYNQIVDVSGGSPQGIKAHENYPYFFVNGSLCAWPGGKDIIKVRTLANTDTTYRDTVDNTKVYPNMMCIRDNLLHAAYPSATSNTSIEHGVYVWGTLEKNYPSSFNYGYVASAHQNGITNTSGNLKIGCVRNFGDEMYMSWKDANGNYGLDIVDSYCDPAPIFKFRARRYDGGAMYRDKQAVKTSLITAPIPNGTTINQIHRIDGGSDVSHATVPTNATEQVVTIQQGLFKRIVYGFDGTCTGTVTPTIYSVVLQYNPLMDRSAL